MERIRVAMFTRWSVRCGISDYCRHLLPELQSQSAVASVRIVEAPPDSARATALGALRHYFADARRLRDLGRQMNAEHANLAHIQHQYFFFGGVAPHKNHANAFLNAIRIPVVMTVHEIVNAPPSAPLSVRLALQATHRANFLHPAIQRFMVHTDQDRARLCQIGVSEERIRVIAHGIPAAPRRTDTTEAKRKLGLEGRRVLTMFGFLSQKKGHFEALEAIKRLPNEVTLLFAGDQHPDDHSDYASRLRQRAEAMGLEKRVRFLGYLPEERLPVVLSATDIALAPYSQTSGSGSLALLLASGLPIVASGIPPHKQIEGETPGCLSLCNTDSPADFSARIASILENPAEKAGLEQAARRYAERRSYAKMAEEIVAVYQEVAR